MRFSLWHICVFALVGAVFVSGCRRKPDVILYTSIDREVAEPIIREFERKTGLRVEVQTDTEATRTAGLAQRLEAEKDRPQADVWWGNEPFHTIRLADAGVFVAYESPAASRIPAQFKDPQHRWAGTGLRIRVIAVTTSGPGAAAADSVKSITDLANPSLKDHICMANPIAGTTGGHVAAIYTLWGEQRTEQFFLNLKANGMKLVGGNSNVAEFVGQGAMWAGLTDNDDVRAAQREGGKLKAVVPDQGLAAADSRAPVAGRPLGTLLIPTTVGIVKGSPNPVAARRLIDHLLSDEVEKALLAANFARASVAASADFRGVQIDYTQVARNMPKAVELALKVLGERK